MTSNYKPLTPLEAAKLVGTTPKAIKQAYYDGLLRGYRIPDTFGIRVCESSVRKAASEGLFGAKQKSASPSGVNEQTGLTDGEQACMDAIEKCIEAYRKLPKQHPSEPGEFVQAIHRIQDLLAIRVVRRMYPEGWASYQMASDTQ